MTTRPLSVIITSIFIILNVLIWLALGIIIAANIHPALPVPPQLKGMMGFLSISLAGILIILFIFLMKGNRSAYYLTLAIFIFTALLTIFDDVGLADMVVLALNIIPIVLLIKDQTWYLQINPSIKQNG